MFSAVQHERGPRKPKVTSQQIILHNNNTDKLITSIPSNSKVFEDYNASSDNEMSFTVQAMSLSYNLNDNMNHNFAYQPYLIPRCLDRVHPINVS